MAPQHSTSSPAEASPRIVVDTAAMPDPNSSAASAPCRTASFSSAATTVGLPYRE